MCTLFQTVRPMFILAFAVFLSSVVYFDASAQGMRSGSDSCPKQLQHRSPEQVLEAHLAAFRSGNAALMACDYAKDALLMLPGSVAQGPDQIEAAFAGFFQAAGSLNSLTITSTTVQGGAILMTYKIDSEHILVPQGVDTFVIEKGRIVLQAGDLGGLTTR